MAAECASGTDGDIRIVSTALERAVLRAPTRGPTHKLTGESEMELFSQERDGFCEGERVRLAEPFWGELDPDTSVLLKDWNGPDSGEPPTYPAGSKHGNHHLSREREP